MRKMKAGMTLEEKLSIILSEPDAELTISVRYWDLFEEFGDNVANLFKLNIYSVRGILGRKLTISEVEKLYDKFRKLAMNYENMDNIMDVEFSTCLTACSI
jgi:hypothetical protein